jgi:hypothetical protein
MPPRRTILLIFGLMTCLFVQAQIVSSQANAGSGVGIGYNF